MSSNTTHLKINKTWLCTLLFHSQNTYGVSLCQCLTVHQEGTWKIRAPCPQAAWSLVMETDLWRDTQAHWVQISKTEELINTLLKHRKVLSPFSKRPVSVNSIVPVIHIYFGMCHCEVLPQIQGRCLVSLHP